MEKEVLSVEAFMKSLRGKLAQEISASAFDFVETYEATSSAYFCEAFQEFADSQTSFYYADQRRYYEEHSSACEDALVELYDPDYLADIIKKEGLGGASYAKPAPLVSIKVLKTICIMTLKKLKLYWRLITLSSTGYFLTKNGYRI